MGRKSRFAVWVIGYINHVYNSRMNGSLSLGKARSCGDIRHLNRPVKCVDSVPEHLRASLPLDGLYS